MGSFGERFDRKEKLVIKQQHENITTGRQIQDRETGRIKGKELTKRKILQQNLYRKYRGEGVGMLDAWKKSRAKASEMMLPKQHSDRKHHHSKSHHKKQHHSKHQNKKHHNSKHRHKR